jgi:hypothetical protein
LYLFVLSDIMRLMQILKNKLYQVKIFSKDTKKCVRIIGEKGLTPKKLDIVEDGLIKDLNWHNFWIETVEFNK